MVGLTLLNADVTGRLETRGWSRARARPSRDVSTLPVVGRRLQRTVFFRVVQAPRLLDVRKLGHDHPIGFQSPSSACTWPPRTRNLPPYFSTVPGTCFRYSSNPAGSVTSLSTMKYAGTRGPPHHTVASSRIRSTSRIGGSPKCRLYSPLK